MLCRPGTPGLFFWLKNDKCECTLSYKFLLTPCLTVNFGTRKKNFQNISMDSIYQADVTKIKGLLYNWLKRNLNKDSVDWLDKKISLLSTSNQKKDIYLAFSTATRFVGKQELNLNENDFELSDSIREGWYPKGLTTDQASRILFILSLPHTDYTFFSEVLKQLFETAEVSELVSLYLGLPLYPYPKELSARAIEGFRTNISIVFNAIALNNPYPKDYLNEAAWNQMILKAVFIGSPLYKIQGIDERSNATLASILSDFAHERWAARRPVTPELWRSVGRFINEKIVNDLERVMQKGNELEQKAAALALSDSDFPTAKELIEKYPVYSQNIANKELTWEIIGKEAEKLQ